MEGVTGLSYVDTITVIDETEEYYTSKHSLLFCLQQSFILLDMFTFSRSLT